MVLDGLNNLCKDLTPAPVLIIGTGRNGSSLILRLLDGAPGLACYPNDFNYFRSFEKKTWTIKIRNALITYLLGRYSRDLLREYYFQRWIETELSSLVSDIFPNRPELNKSTFSLDSLSLDSHCSKLPQKAMNFFFEICKQFGEVAVDAVPVVKTTEPGMIFEYLKMFPGARCVHVFRDPVQTYASIKRTHHFKSRPPWYDGGDILREIIDVRWNPHVNAFRELVEKEPKKHIALIYEEVVKNPHAEISKVCAFLGVEPPKNLAEQTVLGGFPMIHSASNSSQKGVGTPKNVVANLESQAGYLNVLEQREVQLISMLTQKNAEYLGYSKGSTIPRDSDLSKINLLVKWCWPDIWEVKFWYNPFNSLWFILNRRLWIASRLLRK